jgi:hypothetical protein
LKPNPKEQEEKKIRAIVRETTRLQNAILSPASIPLKEPIQRGWGRRYVLAKEAELRPDRETLLDILRDIGREIHSRHPGFLEKKHWRSRKLVEIKQPLREILVDCWSTKRHPRPDAWKRYFHLEYKHYYYNCGFQWFYVFTDKKLFELKVEPHWLTHVKVIDAQLIEREAELDAWMDHHNGWRRHRRLKGKWAYCHPVSSWHRRHELERQEKADLRRVLTTCEEAEMKSSVVWLHFSFFPFPHVAQRRGTPLRTEPVRVQILPWGPPFLWGGPPSLRRVSDFIKLRHPERRRAKTFASNGGQPSRSRRTSS